MNAPAASPASTPVEVRPASAPADRDPARTEQDQDTSAVTPGTYQPHPVATLFPLLDPASQRYRDLVASISRNGLLTPIVLDGVGRILDGRNRLRACKDAKVEPRFVKFSELKLGLNKDHERVGEDEFAFDTNVARRDLTDDQRVAICASYGDYVKANPRGAPRGNINNKPAAKSQLDRTDQLTSSQGATRKKLATKAGVSERKAGQALKVVRKNPALAKRVSSGELRLHEAEKVVDKAEAVSKAATPPAVPQADASVTWVSVGDQVSKAIALMKNLASEVHPSKRATFYVEIVRRMDLPRIATPIKRVKR